MRAILAVALLTLSMPANATVYYMSLAGNDGNAGTSLLTPFKSFQKATSVLQPGDTLTVMPGTYTADGTDDKFIIANVHGTAAAMVTIASSTPQGAIIRNAKSGGVGIDIQSSSWLYVSGFDVSATAADGDGIDIEPGSNHITINGNYVHDNGGGGIGALRADYIRIQYNKSVNNAHTSPYCNSGISLYQAVAADNAPGYHNYIIGNAVWGNYDGVKCPNGGNKVTDGNGIIIDDFQGDQNYDGSVGKPYTQATLVQGNIVWGNGGRCIHMFRSSYVTVTSNTCYGNGYKTLVSGALGELDSYGGTGNSFSHNYVGAVGATIAYLSLSTTGETEDHDVLWNYTNPANVTGKQYGMVVTPGPHTLIQDPKFSAPSPTVASYGTALTAFKSLLTVTP